MQEAPPLGHHKKVVELAGASAETHAPEQGVEQTAKGTHTLHHKKVVELAGKGTDTHRHEKVVGRASEGADTHHHKKVVEQRTSKGTDTQGLHP